MKSLTKISLNVFLMIGLFSGCAQNLQDGLKPTVESAQIDNTLQPVELNGHLEEMTSIAFEWKVVTDPRVEGFYIYRNDPSSQNGEFYRIEKIKSRFSTHFVDNDLKAGTQYQYKFTSFSANGSESVPSDVYFVKTLPLLESVSYLYVTTNMPQSAKIIWRPHPNTDVKSYQIERKAVSDSDWKVIKKIEGRLNAEYIDTDLKNNTSYAYRIRVVTFSGVTSNPSEAFSIVTKPLPVPVLDVRATNKLQGSIVISWSENPETDLMHYKVYRASSPSGSYSAIAKVKDTTFTDSIEENGVVKYYKVTAVDKDGLESLQGDVPAQGSTIEKPKTPSIVSTHMSDNQINIVFMPTDQRTVSYTIIKTTKSGFLNKTTEEITNYTSTNFVDHNVQPDTKYSYEIYSVDANGVKSEPTDSITFDIKAN